MFIEPTITWVPSGFSGCIWLDTKNYVLKKNEQASVTAFIFGCSEFLTLMLGMKAQIIELSMTFDEL